MLDFTLKAYAQYLKAIKGAYQNILRFDDFFLLNEPPENYVIIRHDVDRKPKSALKMARLEAEMGIQSTYYFRTRPAIFRPEIIQDIADEGHEIGYHYESLSDARGDYAQAMVDFETNLKRLREIVPVKTVAMHGSPLSSYDNKDLWSNLTYRDDMKNKYQISGEVYLDISYVNIAYINDTGRNWLLGKSNKRDKVHSSIESEFRDGWALLRCLREGTFPKVIFQIHPERWTDSIAGYCIQWSMDMCINLAKSAIR